VCALLRATGLTGRLSLLLLRAPVAADAAGARRGRALARGSAAPERHCIPLGLHTAIFTTFTVHVVNNHIPK